jgi:hypothetical protein
MYVPGEQKERDGERESRGKCREELLAIETLENFVPPEINAIA